MKVGVHVSIKDSIDLSVDRAISMGCSTFQIFTRSPRGWSAPTISKGVASSFSEKLKKSGISPVVDHMPYLPNLASGSEEPYQKSLETLKEELARCQQLEIPYLVTHLGSHLGTGNDKGYKRLEAALGEALDSSTSKTTILLENTAGQKNSLGTTFEDIRSIMDNVCGGKGRPDLGFCLDTCHAFAGGYDLRTKAGEVFDEIESTIGIEHLRVVHLNDSKGDLGSHLDRHEHIGLGMIGVEGFRSILSDKRVNSLPLILETPVDSKRDDVGNIMKVYELAGKDLPPVLAGKNVQGH